MSAIVFPDPSESPWTDPNGQVWSYSAEKARWSRVVEPLGSAAFSDVEDFAAATHASTHLPAGADELFDQSLNSTDSPTFVDLALTGTMDVLPFDTTNGEPQNLGELAWSQDEETLSLMLKGDTVLQLGEETLYHVENNTGTTIAKGAPVMYEGTVGSSGKLRVKPWDGTDPKAFMGIATMAITGAEGTGYVTHFGKLSGIQTDGDNYGQEWASGNIIYAVSGSANLTNVAPSEGGFVTVAVVISSHGSNGTLFIRPTQVPSLTELGVTGAISAAIAPLETDIEEIQNDQLDLTIATGLDDLLYYYDVTTISSGSIPAAIQSVRIGNQVTSIGDYAFQNSQLTSITLTENVTSIDSHAFTNSQLTSVIIPEGLTSIGAYAFNSCFALGNIDFPSSLESIGNFAFFGAGFSIAIFPEGLTSIGSYAFYSSALTSVTLPESLTSIGSGAFYFCTSLTEANIYTTKTVIDAGGINLLVFTGLTTIHVKESDNTWTEGAGQSIGGITVEVIKDLT